MRNDLCHEKDRSLQGLILTDEAGKGLSLAVRSQMRNDLCHEKDRSL